MYQFETVIPYRNGLYAMLVDAGQYNGYIVGVDFDMYIMKNPAMVLLIRANDEKLLFYFSLASAS